MIELRSVIGADVRPAQPSEWDDATTHLAFSGFGRLSRSAYSGVFAVPHVDHATVAMLLILGIVGLASVWGLAEALTATIIGGIGFEYYFLPPADLALQNPEHWVALGRSSSPQS